MKYNKDYDKPMSYELPPVGITNVEITAAEEKLSSKGNDMIAVTMVVEQGNPGAGCRLYDYVVDNPDRPEQASTKMGTILRACGKKPKDEFELIADALVGLKGKVMVSHEEYNGVEKARVRFWVEPLEDEIPF